MAEVNLDKIFASFILSLEDVVDVSELTQIEKEYLGKGSVLSEERAKLASLSNDDKKKYGSLLKDFANKVSKKLESFKVDFEKSYFTEKEKSENPDISLDWFSKKGTRKHILTNVMEEVVDIFASLGYTVAHGPEAETSWHNFDALNTPDSPQQTDRGQLNYWLERWVDYYNYAKTLSNIQFIAYEDFVAQPKKVLERISTATGIALKTGGLELYQKTTVDVQEHDAKLAARALDIYREVVTSISA